MAVQSSLKKQFHLLICAALLAFPVLPVFAEESRTSTIGVNSSGRLRAMQDSDGTFLLNYSGGTISSQVTASDENMILRMVDSLGRVQKEVYWNKDYSTIEKEVSFEYTGNQITATTETRWFSGTNRQTVLEYDDDGRLSVQKEYSGAESSSDTVHRKLEVTRFWKWDSKGRCVTEKITTESTKVTERTEYVYEAGFRQPDQRFYENDVLIKELEWQTDSDYIERLYFDNGFEIVSQYSDGIQISEKILSNGKEIRSGR